MGVKLNEWTEALRSGRYVQGTQDLYNDDNNTYCCLGVLCDIVDRDFADHFEVVGTTDIGWTFDHIDFSDFFEDEQVTTYLASLNDSGVVSFRMIADEIEALKKGETEIFDTYVKNYNVSETVALFKKKWGV